MGLAFGYRCPGHERARLMGLGLLSALDSYRLCLFVCDCAVLRFLQVGLGLVGSKYTMGLFSLVFAM